MPTASTTDDLLTLLEAGETLLLPNAASAQRLRALAQPRCSSPAVFAWSQWTQGLFTDLILAGHETRILLNAAQEHALWLEVLTAEPPPNALEQLDSVADLAASAYQLAADFNALARLGPTLTTEDTRLFAKWADAFTRLCARHSYLPAALLESALLHHLSQGTFSPPASLHLVDMAEPTPAQTALLNALVSRGTRLTAHTLHSPNPGRQQLLLAAPDPRRELQLAARWVRQYLDAAPPGTAPTVAILLPDLEADRADLEAALRDELAPELHDIALDLSSTPWHFAGGPPLHAQPLVAAALGLARWCLSPLPLERISALLLSPYLSPGMERETAAVFDLHVLREVPLLRPELTLPEFLALARNPSRRAAATTPPLLARLQQLHLHLRREGDLSRPRSWAEWSDLQRSLLKTAGWPGDESARPLTATDLAVTRSWDAVLDLLSTLDLTGRRIPFAAFLDALERHSLTATLAAPRTSAVVQVMGLTQAAGSVFDAILVLRSTDDVLPPSPRPHPLLSWPLQRSLGMPGADPALSSARAAQLTQSLLTRASTTLFTLAEEDAEGKLRPSPLLASLHLNRIPAPEPDPTLLIELESPPDDTPLPALAAAAHLGGVDVLKRQAACGFQAFATHRLRASAPGTASLGLDAGESGTLVHRVLHLLWDRVRTQAELLALGEDGRVALLTRCIEDALASVPAAISAWDGAYLELTRLRLLQLLTPWLNEELARPPFTVQARETRQQLTLGPLAFNLRVDRIDEVEGGLFLIDYKTGAQADPKQWMGERPDEPQLPLYTLVAFPQPIRGLAFARLRAGDAMQWAGLQTAPRIFPASARKPPLDDLEPQIEAWRRTLTQLAEDFAAGRALVDPKSHPDTCNLCTQRLLCRLDPASLRSADADQLSNEDLDG